MDRLQEAFARTPPPTPQQVTEAFWQACHGGQRRAAEYLLERGADLNWVAGWDQHTPLDMAQTAGAEDLVEWLQGHGARSADPPR
jgi:ankyrin repeat protein